MKNAKIDNAAASGDLTVVPAAAGMRVKVLGYLMTSAGPVVVTWKSNTTTLSGPMSMATGTAVGAQPGGGGDERVAHLLAGIGEALILTAGAAVQISGHLSYELVPG